MLSCINHSIFQLSKLGSYISIPFPPPPPSPFPPPPPPSPSLPLQPCLIARTLSLRFLAFITFKYHDTTMMLIGLLPYTKHSAVSVSLKLVLLLAASSNVNCQQACWSALVVKTTHQSITKCHVYYPPPPPEVRGQDIGTIQTGDRGQNMHWCMPLVWCSP